MEDINTAERFDKSGLSRQAETLRNGGLAEEAGVEPTEDACAPSNGFEARAPHRERYSSADQNRRVFRHRQSSDASRTAIRRPQRFDFHRLANDPDKFERADLAIEEAP